MGRQSILGWGCCQPCMSPQAVTVMSPAASLALFSIFVSFPPPSLLSFFFNERLKIRLTEVTGCVSHPPARCCGGLGGQWALCGEAVSMVGTLRGGGYSHAPVPSGHSSHLEGQGTSLWWGHSPRSPCCHRPLCLHGMATTPGHLTSLGHLVRMGMATTPGHLTPPSHHVPVPGHLTTTVHCVPMAWPPPQSTMSPGHVPTAQLQSQDGFNATRRQQHPMYGDNTPGDLGAAAPYGWGQHTR